jgi:hypothetical protein
MKQQYAKCKTAAMDAMSYATREQFDYLRDVLDILVDNHVVREEEVWMNQGFYPMER